ncbi:MAG TPA: hypothetical protein DCW83_06700 [Saprospirales bacterium]|jgi:hypothetical protein|nr:hypothetical protein [Saprospirales bacterium]
MDVVELDLAQAVSQYGFPIIAAGGLGYFIFYIWKWVTEEVNPVIDESHMTLIALIDRVRMLDNDLIRLKTKLDLVLEKQEKEKNEKENIERTNTVSNVNTKSGKRK